MSESEKRTIVPASAGYDLVAGVTDEAGNIVELAYTPVVAWVVQEGKYNTSTWPVALGMHEHMNGLMFIRTPKGHYYDLEGNLFEDEQSALEEMQKRSD